ncbi:MAG: pyridoxamine 5'-phosphate oxidase [Hyphococcus sp.]|nr:MAG: pyridoxamine 5'-phosphate oxidase [Marinicaulis sp.]
MKNFGEIMFTDAVQVEQSRRGSRDGYAKMTARPAPTGLSDREAAFIAERDSFYMASVTQTGWPYVQHRGGPKGFLKIINATTLGMADYRGNKQYVSTGNFKIDNRVSLFLMDYPNRARLKLLARVNVEDVVDNPKLAEQFFSEGQGRVEQLMTFTVEAFDWNCPQFITPRFTENQVRDVMKPKLDELDRLEVENAALKDRLAALGA